MPLPQTPHRREPGGYGIRPYGAPRGLHFPGRPPCFPGFVGRAFTPAAPCRFKIGNIPAAANTPCRGRFYIGPACPAAYPRGRAMALPCKPGQTSWLLGLPGTQNLPVGAGFIPPANPAPPQTPRDDASIVPYMGLQRPRGLYFPGGRRVSPAP